MKSPISETEAIVIILMIAGVFAVLPFWQSSVLFAGVGYLVFVAGGYYAARKIGATANNLFIVLIGAVVLSSVLFWALDVAGAILGSALLGVSWRLDVLYLSALYLAAVIAYQATPPQSQQSITAEPNTGT
jgi:hypothetical protein